MPFAKIDDTLEMYYEDDNFTDPWRGEPETVVLHHGNSKNTKLWYAWVPLLARQYRVIRLDARGFGQSSVPPEGYDWSLSNWGTDMLKLLDQLGIDKVHLIGETVGGTIALQFAYDHPERLHTLTTCTSPYKFAGVDMYQGYYKLVSEEGVAAWVQKTAERRLEPGKSDPAHHQWYIDQMSQTSKRVVLESLAYLGTQDLTDILPQIKTPTMVLVSEQSAKESPDRTTVFAEKLGNGRLVTIPGTSGYVQHSAPEACVLAWRQFLGEISGK
ncbi:MAG: alpha/beta fold hydrolase [Chloroflexi bacterium]|nr:alpha/beta fold hydrolase [Chloroflexota bacterium]